ncbi:MAG: hypothetical protein JXB49_25385 [Bacteroidales bacterium]|nr:hypothetical protein [Bacteroidales bacterium]
MKSLFVNANNAIKEKNYYYEGKGKISLKTIYIASLMNGVGIYRLYTKDDFYRLIYRLGVVHHQNGILESFFTDDVLFRFKHGDKKYTITPLDLQNHFGLQISEPVNNINDKQWLTDVKKIWNGSQQYCWMIGKINKQNGVFNQFMISKKISPKMKRDARLLVSILKKELDPTLFKQWNKANAEFLIEFKKEKERRERKFNIADIPDYIIYQFDDHLDKYYDFNYEDDEELIYEMIKLAWCYALDLVYSPTNGPLLIYPEVSFNYDLFEGINGQAGIPTLEAIYDYLELGFLVELIKEEFSDD